VSEQSSFLRRLDLFSELAEDELEVLASHLSRRAFRQGEVIFVRGDAGNTLYFIESGRVRIVLTSAAGKELVLTILESGDFFGDLALLDGEPRSADAIAHNYCRLLLLRQEDFYRSLESRPRMAASLLHVMARRLRRNADIIEDAAFLDVPARLARMLLQLGEEHGRADGGVLVVTPAPSQSELAGMVGATRESVNKWLAKFRQDGLIRVDRGQLIILDTAGLKGRTY